MTMTVQHDLDVGLLRYRVYGLTLASNVSFPELPPAVEPEPLTTERTISIHFSMRHSPLSPPSHWLPSKTLPDEEPWLSSAKTERGYLLRFHKLADFSVDAEGREIVGVPEGDTSPATLRHLLLDNVLPLALTLQGHDTLHATAVLTRHGVCAFIGPSGAGKSTLAASFLFADYPVLSDDCLILRQDRGQILATPAYPGVRLWNDALDAFGVDHSLSLPVAHYASKRRPVVQNHPDHFPTTEQPVVRIYSLMRQTEEEQGEGTEPQIEHLSPRSGFAELLESTFMLDRTDRTMWLRQFHFLNRLASHVPVKRLHIPNEFASLPAIRQAILEDLIHG
jgi:hypothetical protein